MIYVKIHNLEYCEAHFYKDATDDFFPSEAEHQRFAEVLVENIGNETYYWIHSWQIGETLKFNSKENPEFLKIEPFVEEIYTTETHPEYFL